MKIKRSRFTVILLLLFFFGSDVFAQRVYNYDVAEKNVLSSSGSPAGGDYKGTFISLSFFQAYVEFKFSAPLINAGVTTFIKVSNQTNWTVTAYSGNNSVAAEFELVSNGNETFLAVTPVESYSSIRVFSPSTFGTVYSAFYGHQSDCGAGWTTATSKSGTSTVSDAIAAVDSDNSTSSTLSIKANRKNDVVSQTIYFSSLGSSTDMISLILSKTPGSTSNVFIQAYHHGVPVPNGGNISSSIPSDGSSGLVEIFPENSFDRVTITVSADSESDVSLNVYEAQILPVTPKFDNPLTRVCEGISTTYSISNVIPGVQYSWYVNGSSIPNPPGNSYTTGHLLAGSHTLKVTATKPGCTESSEKTVNITINPKPINPQIKPY